MKKYALVLEGGGAKGAYQVGVYKALKEQGYDFDAIIGTSIGAINAALIVQGEEEKLEKLWRSVTYGDLIEVDGQRVQDMIDNRKFDRQVVSDLRKTARDAVKSFGIRTEKIRELFEKYIDEEKIRKSDIRFGLVTFNVSDFKEEKKFIEDIPKGKLIDYLLATSNLPVFKRAQIDEKLFIDGGATDSCSVEMLYEAGYKDIIAVRLFLRNRIKNYNSLVKKKDLHLKMIVPSQDLPYILNFERKTLNNMVDYGYVDGLKQIKKLDGKIYCVNKIEKEEIEKIKQKITPLEAYEVVKGTGVKIKVGDNILNVLFNKAIPKLSRTVSEHKHTSLKSQILDIIEYCAQKEKIDKNKIYDFNELILLVKEKKNKWKKIKGIDKVLINFIEIL